MIHIVGFFLALIIAASSGLGLTWIAVNAGHGFDRVRIGSWSAWPKAGTPEADPYSKAVIARTGEIPMSAGEGLALQAEQDDAGAVLTGRCVYLVKGSLPPARLWTFTAYDRSGTFRDNPAQRYSFTSAEIIRDADGSFEITVSPEVKAGNWLPVEKDQSLVLLVRLYDTPASSSVAQIGERMTLKIERRACL